MKRISLFAAMLCLVVCAACAKGKQPLAFTALPEPVQTEVLKNFAPEQIQFITGKKAFGHYEYDFVVSDSVKFQYDNRAILRKIKDLHGVKDVFIPTRILEYVQKTFPNAIITKYEKELGKQEVELNNSMDLVFNKYGEFVRIED